MSQAAATMANTAPITGSSTQLQSSNAPPRSPASSIYSTASDPAAAPSTPLPSTLNPLSVAVALSIRKLHFRSRFSYELAQKLHRRQLLFFWRKKKDGLPELRISLKRNIQYFAMYDKITVEDPGLALRIDKVDEEFERQVSTVLALGDGRTRMLRCDSLARLSESCRAQVEGLLEEAMGGVGEVAVVPKEVKEEAAVAKKVKAETTLPKTEPEAAVSKNTAGNNTGAKPTIREVKVPNEIFVPKRRRTPQAQNTELANVTEEAQGGNAVTAT